MTNTGKEPREQDQQELILKLGLYEQQIKQLQEQLRAVEGGIFEMNSLEVGLDGLKGGTDKDIFAPIGRGMFAKAKLTSEELIMDIGNKNFVKKTIPDAQNIIKEQVKKLEKMRQDLNKNLEKIDKELTNDFTEYQKMTESKS